MMADAVTARVINLASFGPVGQRLLLPVFYLEPVSQESATKYVAFTVSVCLSRLIHHWEKSMSPREIIEELRQNISENLELLRRRSDILPKEELAVIEEHHSKIDAALHDALNKFSSPS